MAATAPDPNSSLRRVLVLGASGQVGSPVFQGLKSAFPDADVVGTTRHTAEGLLRFDPWKDDWAELGTFDVAVNCIGAIQPTREHSLREVHVGITERLLRNRPILGNPRILQISALGAAPTHFSEFLKAKGLADEMLMNAPNTCVLRPSIVCTPDTVFLRKLRILLALARRLGGYLFVPKSFPEVALQPVHPDDLAEAVARLCISPEPPKLLNVVGPEVITMRAFLGLVANAHKQRPPRLVRLPDGLCSFAVRRLVGPLFPGLVNAEQFALLMNGNTADGEPLERVLEHKPQNIKPFFLAG